MARGARSTERTFEQLRKEDLATRDYKPVYVFDGPDSHRIEQVVAWLTDAVVDPGSASFNLHTLQGDQAGWQAVLQVAGSYPMFAARQLVHARHVDRMARDEAGEASLLAYFADPMPSTLLVLTAEKLDRRRGWVQDARARGYLVCFQPPRGAQLAAWLRKAAAQEGLELEDDAVDAMIELVGTDLKALASELRKLALLAETWGRAPNADDVRRAVMSQAEIETWALTEHLAPGEAGLALASWRRLREWGEDAQGLAPVVQSHLRRAALVAALLRAGLSANDIAERTGINGWLLRTKLIPYARTLDAARERRLLGAAATCERSLKRSPVASSLALEGMLLAATVPDSKGEP